MLKGLSQKQLDVQKDVPVFEPYQQITDRRLTEKHLNGDRIETLEANSSERSMEKILE